MLDDRQIASRKRLIFVRALQRIALVLVTTSILFLTLVVAGLPARAEEAGGSAVAQAGQACPEPCRRATQLPLALSAADVSIVKSDANPNVRPGGTLTHRIFYENGGALPATDVVITDTLPAHTTHLYNDAGSEDWTTTITDTMIIWHRDVISPAVSGNFDVVLSVSEDAPAGASLVNQVEIATATNEDNTDNNTWTTQPTVVRVADVRITKIGPAEVSSGDRITYTIEYRNEGSEPADDVVITDTLPAGVSYVEWSGDVASPPAVNGQQVVWQAGALQPASVGSLILIGQIDLEQPSYSTLTNTVTISTRTPERDQGDNVATSVAVVRAGAPDSVQVSVPATVTANTSATFTAEALDRWGNPVADDTPVSFASSALVTPDPSAVTVRGVATATLSAGTEVGPAVITATAGSAVGTGTLEVVPGPVGELRLTAAASAQTVGEAVGLRAEVFDGYGNSVDTGIPVSFTTTLGEVQPPTTDTDAAGIVTATLVSTRTGTAIVSAHSVGFQDSATVRFTPGPTEQITVTADPPAVPVDGATSQMLATLTDRYGNRVGDGITVTFDSSLGRINPMTATTVAGEATAVLTSGPIHGRSSVTVTVGTYTGTTTVEFLPADLRIQSTHSPSGEILPGTAVTYTITYENIGDAVAKDVVITDTLPVGFIDTSFESSGAAVTATEGTSYIWEVEDLSPGEGGTIILRGHFDRHRQWPPSQLVANVAEIGSATAEGNPEDNGTSAGNIIITADVFIQGIVDDAGTDLRPGGKIRYQASLGNRGQAPAQGLIITDTLPAYTSLWQETSHQIPGLSRVSEDDASVQVWRYDGTVDGPNFGRFSIWLNIDPGAPGGAMLRNRIEISTDTPEGDYTDNAHVTERRLSGVNLEVLLRGPATAIPGRAITYTLRYTNTGTLPAEDVVLTDVMPAGVSVIDVSRTPARLEPELIEWNLGRLARGEWGQVLVVGRVSTDIDAGQTLHNAIDITTTSVESFSGDNSSGVDTRVIPDAPDSLALEMDPTTVAVGATAPLSIFVADQFGNPIDGLTVTLTTTIGVVTPTLVTTIQGAATASFVAPTSPAEGTITAMLALSAAEVLEDLSDAVQVVVEPGQPSDLRLEATATELPANGQSTAVIRSYVKDVYGNPVKDDTSVTFDTDRGTLYNGQSRHTVGTLDGIASTVLTTGRSPGLATVIASAGTASAEIQFDFVTVPWHYVRLPFITRNMDIGY